MTKEYQEIIFDVIDQVGIIGLNRPEKLNTFTWKIWMNWKTRSALWSPTTISAAFVLWGNEKVFSAGADYNVVATLDNPMAGYRFISRFHGLANRIEALNKPTVAAVAGHCLGGAFSLLLSTDIRIASEGAKMGLPQMTRGSVPSGGGIIRLAELIGISRAKYYAYTGRSITAAEALPMGLVNQVVADGTLYEKTLETAKKFAALSPNAVLMTKTSVAGSMNPARYTALEHDRKCYAILCGDKTKMQDTKKFLNRDREKNQ